MIIVVISSPSASKASHSPLEAAQDRHIESAVVELPYHSARDCAQSIDPNAPRGPAKILELFAPPQDPELLKPHILDLSVTVLL
jgi:hypothetical protein